MTNVLPLSCTSAYGFPAASLVLEKFGLKFSPGGAHISRTMMLAELDAVLGAVPNGSSATDYRDAILQRNVLGKTTDSTRQKSLRHLRELYALDEAAPIFGLLRRMHGIDSKSLASLAVQVAWARDPLFRATTPPMMEASEGERVETAILALGACRTELGVRRWAGRGVEWSRRWFGGSLGKNALGELKNGRGRGRRAFDPEVACGLARFRRPAPSAAGCAGA